MPDSTMARRTAEEERDSLARRLGKRYEQLTDLRYRLAALESVLADREKELLELKGPCRGGCRLHYAHSGPCDIKGTERVAT